MRGKIINEKDPLKKLQILKEHFAQKDFVVFSCGPSLNEIDKKKMQEFCQDKNVICIKHSYFRYKDICNFHFYNDNNLVEYGHDDNVIAFSSSGAPYEIAKNSFWKNQREADLHFQIQNNGFENSIAIKNNFEETSIEKIGLKRPWGPGIIIECVFPFLVYMRPKKIYTLGWDYGPREITGETHLEHFYSNDKRKHFVNPAEVCVKNENISLIESSKKLNFYLKTLGIELIVLSQKSYVHEEIKRLKI